MRQPLRARRQRHGLPVLVAVHFDGRVKFLAQGVAVGGVANNGEDDASVVGVEGGVVVRGVRGGANFEEFGGVRVFML